jgi:hypothetical protein
MKKYFVSYYYNNSIFGMCDIACMNKIKSYNDILLLKEQLDIKLKSQGNKNPNAIILNYKQLK